MRINYRAVIGVLGVLLFRALPVEAAESQFPVAEGLTFSLDTAAQVRMCESPGVGCGQPVLIQAATPTNCGWWVFGAVNRPGVFTRICEKASPAPSESTAFSSCWPAISAANYSYEAVPESVGSDYPYIGIWTDACTNQKSAQFFGLGDIASLLVAHGKGMLGNSDAINEWVKSQPVTKLTATEEAFKLQVLAKYAPPPPPVQKFVVQPESKTVNGSRPVYRLRADGTRNTTAVSGKRINGGNPCKGDKRIGTTSYYSVQGANFSDGTQIIEDLYAVCQPVP